jgi:phosphoenolpyruvate synthase/pyruvate phosphate dikinase
VRSSSTAEDLADASFAGQYETVLGVSTLEDVVAAVGQVRASAATVHAAAYREQQTSGTDAGMAVLVQPMVAAHSAGIAFSANPVTGADEVVIEAVRGLGDALASGDADAERWNVAAGAARPLANTGVLDEATANGLRLSSAVSPKNVGRRRTSSGRSRAASSGCCRPARSRGCHARRTSRCRKGDG